MFECFIWLMIQEGAQHHWESIGSDEDEDTRTDAEQLRTVQAILRSACDLSGIPFDRLNLRYTWGGFAVSAGYGANHAGNAPEPQRLFLEEVARNAPSSYGVIYMMDTERSAMPGEFTVLKLANRKVSQSFGQLVRPAGAV